MGAGPPKADPKIGIAAEMSAQTGKDMLNWQKQQAQITNQWAIEDRDRYKTKFEPMQDQLIDEANTWNSDERRSRRVNESVADVENQASLQTGARNRQMTAMGVRPDAGRFQSESIKGGNVITLAKAGAANLTRRSVEAEAGAKKASAVNMGNGMAVNPGTSMGLSSGAMASGASAAMAGYGQQANLLNTQHNQQMNAYNQQQAGIGALAGTAGRLLTSAPLLAMLSSKEAKTDKKPARGVLKSVENLPVDEWTYKAGMGDEGRHIGPYAEDFRRETGKGDGKSIPVVDGIGLALGAIKELSAKVDKIAA